MEDLGIFLADYGSPAFTYHKLMDTYKGYFNDIANFCGGLHFYLEFLQLSRKSLETLI